MKKYLINVEFESGKKDSFEVTANSKGEAMQKGRELIHNPSINYGFTYYATEIKQPTKNN